MEVWNKCCNNMLKCKVRILWQIQEVKTTTLWLTQEALTEQIFKATILILHQVRFWKFRIKPTFLKLSKTILEL